MKNLVVFVVVLFISIPFSFAVEIQELFTIQSEESVEEVSSDGFGVVTYFYSGNKLLATKEMNGNLEYEYQDRLGSDVNTRTLPFGQEISSENRFSFTGKELDKDLYYFGARYYDSDLGRFTSVDSVEDQPAYQYVSNDPMNYVDPTGNLPSMSLINYQLENLEYGLVGVAPTIEVTAERPEIDYPETFLPGGPPSTAQEFQKALQGQDFATTADTVGKMSETLLSTATDTVGDVHEVVKSAVERDAAGTGVAVAALALPFIPAKPLKKIVKKVGDILFTSYEKERKLTRVVQEVERLPYYDPRTGKHIGTYTQAPSQVSSAYDKSEGVIDAVTTSRASSTAIPSPTSQVTEVYMGRRTSQYAPPYRSGRKYDRWQSDRR